ncbi:glycosyltransferase [Candidatus Pristimantibacillus sp. PTI5]|uniref:glycosyltransferase n=1 Tax=Candidatus Pristimantibacillus sp. PTI5 TaxID=3400422 RepID=UPI003B02C4A3
MKKKLLFIIPGLSAGGGERSLINLLSHIDYTKYDVDLFLLSHEGIFMGLLPANVRVLPLPNNYRQFALPLWLSVSKFIAKGKINLAYNRFMFSLQNRMDSSIGIREQNSWKHVANAMNIIDSQYDAAIGFLEKTSIYFCVDKVNATKKIGWVHNDYDKLEMDPNFDLNYFENLDNIITVSDECANVLVNRFPNQEKKVKVIYNIVSPGIIHKLANEVTTDVYHRNGDEIIILSIGRLHTQKGFELAIMACKKLLQLGYNIRWNVIGEGDERDRLTTIIKQEGLDQHFILLGLMTNPYPYLKQADIYAQTSRYEGKAIAIDEAKILSKPIVVTNFSTARDQIVDGVEGLIVEMNADSVAAGIGKLIQNADFSRKMKDHLSCLHLGTEEEINKLYKLLC